MNLKWALANSIKWTLDSQMRPFSTDRTCQDFYFNAKCNMEIMMNVCLTFERGMPICFLVWNHCSDWPELYFSLLKSDDE